MYIYVDELDGEKSGESHEGIMSEVFYSLGEETFGVSLKTCLGGRGAYVDSYYRADPGTPLKAEIDHIVLPGDILQSINEEVIADYTVDVIYTRLSTLSRPIELQFLRLPTKGLSPSQELSIKNDLRNHGWMRKFLRSRAKSTIEDIAAWTSYCLAREWYGNLRHHPLLDSTPATLSLDLKDHDTAPIKPTSLPHKVEKAIKEGVIAVLSSISAQEQDYPDDIPDLFDALQTMQSTYLQLQRTQELFQEFIDSDIHLQMQAYYYLQPNFTFLSLHAILMMPTGCLLLHSFLSTVNVM